MSRSGRERPSRRPGGSSPCSDGVEVLGQLDAVPVAVVDVEQAHLAVQLEHNADLDARGTQAAGLGLDVLDLDDGDRASRVGLALLQRTSVSPWRS